jgi:hypothetical protein
VLTTPFSGVMNRLLSYWKPDSVLPVVQLDHPIQNLSQEMIEKRAVQLASAVENILSQP